MKAIDGLKGIGRKEASGHLGRFCRLDSPYYIPALIQQVHVYGEEICQVLLMCPAPNANGSFGYPSLLKVFFF